MMDIEKVWRVFHIRRVLLTAPNIGFVWGGLFNASIRFKPIIVASASILYVDLVSILDGAFENVMTTEDYDRGKKMKNRIEMMARIGRVLDKDALIQINEHRNVVAHELEEAVSIEELGRAIKVIEDQLLAWGLINKRLDYKLAFVQSKMEGGDDPEVAFKRDNSVLVMDGDNEVAVYTVTSKWYRDEK